MLRTTTNNLSKSSIWKNPIVYSCFKNYATIPNDMTPVANEEKKDQEVQPSLSSRLGGTGRGKILAEEANDALSAFLINNKRFRNNRNGVFTPSSRKHASTNDDQFSDAVEDQKPRMRSNNRNRLDTHAAKAVYKNNNNNDSNNNNDINSNSNSMNNSNSKNDNRNRNDNKNKNDRRSFNKRNKEQPQEIRAHRATIFIDKDIDWSSIEAMTSTPSVEMAVIEEDDKELLLKEVEDDYNQYLNVGSNIQWSNIEGTSVSHLVGSNPTFNLKQKTAFLAAVSAATTISPNSIRK
ncbi:uncharacterized protein BX663DRAFT_507181 [Cokeromyces recurvatus]|uniref:uncharacterized protein n=1 Tax=Cokeromyces recurvatus TaxID=90255 RepID=UPI002220D1A4|nr:uncharacterized protein BX663DRAFT_507181 [Cokeromyces recurvatus]KAI7903644.1 hypothetical protein BX663DRAFT_507181 [Cokeromyces recurvatus]